MRLLLYHFCVNLPVMLLSYPVFRAMGMRSTLPLPSWYSQVLYVLCLVLFSLLWPQTLCLIVILASSFLCFHTFLYIARYVLKDPFKSDFLFLLCRKEVVPQIIFYFILEDFVFYWGHRILHTKWLYQHIHSVHHEWVRDSNAYVVIETRDFYSCWFRVLTLWYAGMPLHLDWHLNMLIQLRYYSLALQQFLDQPSQVPICSLSGYGWFLEFLRLSRHTVAITFLGVHQISYHYMEGEFMQMLDSCLVSTAT